MCPNTLLPFPPPQSKRIIREVKCHTSKHHRWFWCGTLENFGNGVLQRNVWWKKEILNFENGNMKEKRKEETI